MKQDSSSADKRPHRTVQGRVSQSQPHHDGQQANHDGNILSNQEPFSTRFLRALQREQEHHAQDNRASKEEYQEAIRGIEEEYYAGDHETADEKRRQSSHRTARSAHSRQDSLEDNQQLSLSNNDDEQKSQRSHEQNPAHNASVAPIDKNSDDEQGIADNVVADSKIHQNEQSHRSDDNTQVGATNAHNDASAEHSLKSGDNADNNSNDNGQQGKQKKRHFQFHVGQSIARTFMTVVYGCGRMIRFFESLLSALFATLLPTKDEVQAVSYESEHSQTSIPKIWQARVKRIYIVLVILAIFAGLIAGRLAWFQLFEGTSLASTAQSSRTVKRVITANRGKILDNTGAVLAQSVERYTIFADQRAAANFVPIACTPQTQDYCNQIDGKNITVTGPAAIARMLAPVLHENATDLGGRLVGNSGYVVLKRNVTPQVKRSIDALHISGVVGAQRSVSRNYPEAKNWGAFLGATDEKNHGVSGIEMLENDILSGKDGSQTYQQGVYGEKIPGTEVHGQEPIDGGTVRLTLNNDVQWFVKKVLTEQQKKVRADWGIALVQEVATGNILAAVDTDNIAAGSTEAKLNTSRVMTETYEPGSTSKLISMSAVLQQGIHKPTDRFVVPSTMTYDHQQYKDAENHPSNLTLAGILAWSSNIGTIKATEALTNQQRYDWLRKFGIGQDTGFSFPGMSHGILHSPMTWDNRTRNTVMFGQGYSSNLLEMTNVVATIANKGVKLPQRIIASVTDREGHTEIPAAPQPQRVIDAQVAHQMMNMMENVADTLQSLYKFPGYRMAGKSGTSENPDGHGGLNRIVGSWIAAVPADNPKYIVSIAFQNPDTLGGFASIAAAATISSFLMQKYDVPPSAPRTEKYEIYWH